jgi:hypothetical protein
VTRERIERDIVAKVVTVPECAIVAVNILSDMIP